MTIAVLIPYRPDTPERAAIQAITRRLWGHIGVEVVYSDDGLTGDLFSYARAVNRARKRTTADVLLTYNVDALPIGRDRLDALDTLLTGGTPWAAVFEGQVRFTQEQTEMLIRGVDPAEVGEPAGDYSPGREALLAIRADVWDELRGWDERYVGWGPEDLAMWHILTHLYPEGRQEPSEGPFRSLWHPLVTRRAFHDLTQVWEEQRQITDPVALRAWYLARP